MKEKQRILTALIAAVLLLAAAGCKPLLPNDETQPIPMDTAAGTPSAETVPSEPTPEATATPDPDLGSEFQALDLEIFRWYATQDGYSFHQLISNPEDFGIDRASVNMTLGEFTEESSAQYALEAAGYLERLAQIPRARLTADEQLSYDILAQYLENIIEEADYEYYYEPLTEYNGLHASLPLSFALFKIESVQDANDYLMLLADVPRYLGQVLSYERRRAELGMFMTETALNAILKGCKSIIDSRNNSFLYATFDAAIDEISALDEEQASVLKLRNAELIKNDFIGAYRTLYDGLDALRGKCRAEEGVYKQGEKALAYFEMQFRREADNELTIEESLELLQDEMQYMLTRYYEIYEENPRALSAVKGKLTSGNTDTDLALLRQITNSILPALPEHTLQISDVPEELESLMSPAAYVIPSLDDWNHNEVLINPASESITPLFTLAHETYPGHLYQYAYQRGLSRLGVMQRALHYGAYAEGWSQTGEYLFVQNQTQYDKDYCYLNFYNNIIVDTLVPSIVSIWVNYQGYSKEAIVPKLDSIFGARSESTAEVYYQLVVNQPYYTVCYGMGIAQMMHMLRDAENDLGDAFDQKAFLTAYLDLGPGYYNILKERMDVWVDEHILEVLGE